MLLLPGLFQGSFALCTFAGMGFKAGQAIPEGFSLIPRAAVGAGVGSSSGAWERSRAGTVLADRVCRAVPSCAGLGEGHTIGGIFQTEMQPQLAIIFFQKCGQWFLIIFNFS